MAFNDSLANKNICEYMTEHTAAQYAYSNAFVKLVKNYGHVYIKLFGYPAELRSRILARYILKVVPKKPDGTLLDVGCSHGAYSFELAKLGYRVTGVDVNKESIDLANKINKILDEKNVKFYHGDILNCDIRPGMFDIITIFEALEHIKEDDKLIKKFYNILNNNGSLIISVPYNDLVEEYNEPVGACHTKDRQKVIIGDGGGHYRNGYNEKRITELLNDNGFIIRSVKYICIPKTLPKTIYLFPIVYPLALLLNDISKTRINIVVIATKDRSFKGS